MSNVKSYSDFTPLDWTLNILSLGMYAPKYDPAQESSTDVEHYSWDPLSYNPEQAFNEWQTTSSDNLQQYSTDALDSIWDALEPYQPYIIISGIVLLMLLMR